MYQCQFLTHGSLFSILYGLIFGLIYSLIPLCIIVVLNILIMRKINSQRKFSIKHQTSKHVKPKVTSNLTITMFVVCVAFVITTVPPETLYIVLSMSTVLGTTSVPFIALVSYRLKSINHSMNFLLYCLPGSVFRQTFFRLFTCRNKKMSTEHTTSRLFTVQGRV